MLLSFVIPCYRSERTVAIVIDEIIETVLKKPQYDYEIIAVNDCSPDNVYTVLKEIAAKNPRVKLIDLARNRGKHSAVMAAFHKVQGDIVIGLDDDGQCPIDRLWDLIDPLEHGDYDMAMAQYPQKKQSRFKNVGSGVNAWMTRMLLDKPKEMVFSNFTARKRFVCEEIIRYTNPYPYLEGLTLRAISRIAMVPMEERKRIAGRSGYTLKRSLRLWLNGFTAFSVKPLRLSAFVGILFAVCGFLYALYLIVRRLLGAHVRSGYSSLLAVILISSGIIMLCLGMIGEYLGRVYISINNSPQFVVREAVNFDLPEDSQ